MSTKVDGDGLSRARRSSRASSLEIFKRWKSFKTIPRTLFGPDSYRSSGNVRLRRRSFEAEHLPAVGDHEHVSGGPHELPRGLAIQLVLPAKRQVGQVHCLDETGLAVRQASEHV